MTVGKQQALALSLARSDLASKLREPGLTEFASSARFLSAVLQVAAASSPAKHLGARFIVRGGQDPGVAAIGRLTDEDVARMRVLFEQIRDLIHHLRYVSYAQAERDVAVLSERMQDRIPSGDLEDAEFTAIPRGGLIVLGMLAITMGLEHHHLTPTPDGGDRLLVIIDDSALTGLQLRRSLERAPDRRVAFGLLYAPEPLCDAVEAQEPRVHACVSAHRLADVGDAAFGDAYPDWIEKWQRRLSEKRYWIGHPQPVHFAWKEPDRSFINEVTGQWESGWKTLPADLCLDNRGKELHVDVQLQDTGVGPLAPSDHVFFADVDGQVVVADQSSEQVVSLDPVATAMWRAMLKHGSRDGMLAELLSLFDVDADELSRDIDAFIDGLCRSGLVRDAVA